MDAIVSGRAAALALIEGDDTYVAHSTDMSNLRRLDFGMLKYVFEGAYDVMYLPRISRDDAFRKFSGEIRAEEALGLTLILLDGSETVEVRNDAACELTHLIEDGETRSHIKNVLFSVPLPRDADIGTAIGLSSPFPASSLLLGEIERMQPVIERIRSAWDEISNEVFGSTRERQGFFSTATKRGAFRELAEAVVLGPKNVNAAVLQILLLLRDQPNYRSVITEWTSDLRDKSQRFRDDVKLAAQNEAERAEIDERRERIRIEGVHEAFQRVLAQQRAITLQLRAGKITLARQFAEDLIESQLEAEEPNLAAKSLCSLAQEANGIGQYSLQLEWAKAASEIAPEDPITYGHLADAYLHLSRFDEASAALDQVDRLGDARFSETNRARSLRLQGRLDEALVAFDQMRRAYGTEDGNSFAWNGYAEVLRDMWRFPQALAAYEEAVAAYPNNVVARSGKGAVLTELGRLDDAEAAYQQVLDMSADTLFALAGKANVLKHKGRLGEALALYEQVGDRYPTNSIALAGRANILRLMQRYDEALGLLREGRRRFPYEVALAAETAEVFRDKGLLEDAAKAYERARTDFPWAPRIINGLAQVNKEMGDFRVALQMYDENIRRFPYDVISRSGRADVLKRLHEYTAALEAYDDIIGRWPERLGARHSKAAVLVVLGRFDEAEALLPNSPPESVDEWIANHVRGMILLRSEKIAEAIAHLESGLERVPFARERKYFQNALAVAYLHQERFDQIDQLIPQPNEPISNVLVLHASAAMGQTARATTMLNMVQRSGLAEVIELSSEIARRFRLSNEPPRHDKRWIFRTECQAVLLEAA